MIESFATIGLSIPSNVFESLKDDGLLLPWELKRRILGLRGSEWVPIVLAYAQANWGVNMPLNWQDDNASCCEDREKIVLEKIVTSFWKAWEERLNELCYEVEACPGAPELVEGLRAAKIPMAIATSSRLDSVNKKKVKHERMFQSFQEIVTGDDVENGKPAPDIYLEAAKRLGVHPSECLVFEDALSGAQSGRSAGCHVVAVPDKRMEKDLFLSVSDEIIDDMWQFSGKQWGIPVGNDTGTSSLPAL